MSLFNEAIVSVIVYVHVSYSERFLRKSYFTVLEFGFGAQNCPSLKPYFANLDFCLWGVKNGKVYRTKVGTKTNCAIT